MENTQENKRTASQRLADMEQTMVMLSRTVDMIARDLMLVKDAIQMLGNKLDATAKAVARGERPEDDVINKIMIENNVESLKQKVDKLIENGVLVVGESVTDRSFVVGREIDEAGAVMNPRLQFATAGLQKPLKDKLLNSKVGDIVQFEEGKLKFEVTEVYTIKIPEAPAEEVKTAESVAEVVETVTETVAESPVIEAVSE